MDDVARPDASPRSGMLLLACAAAALLWTNLPGPFGEAYETIWQRELAGLSLRLWINDAGMALFFLGVGLEIRLSGALHGAPLVGALGGMLVPAAVYVATMLVAGQPVGRGWGIPMATDIAFALGVLSLLGDRVSRSARRFLLSLAVADDLGAVVVIAVFFASGLRPAMLGVGALTLASSWGWGLWVRGRGAGLGHAVLGGAAWLAFLNSGIHPTVAGVLLAFTLPREKAVAWEGPLQAASAWLIMPVFALANAGVRLGGVSGSPAVLAAVSSGLVIGKPVGIWLGARVAEFAKLARPSERLHPVELGGIACLGGIGFTMSIFVAALAFAGDERAMGSAKAAILLASVLASGLGSAVLLRSPRPTAPASRSSARPS